MVDIVAFEWILNQWTAIMQMGLINCGRSLQKDPWIK